MLEAAPFCEQLLPPRVAGPLVPDVLFPLGSGLPFLALAESGSKHDFG